MKKNSKMILSTLYFPANRTEVNPSLRFCFYFIALFKFNDDFVTPPTGAEAVRVSV